MYLAAARRDQVETGSQVIDAVPQLDVLVSNAAISYPVDLLSDPLARWRDMVEVNMWGGVLACRAAGEKMIRQGKGGRIIIISSILSGIAEPGSTHYAMAKAALNQLGRQLAVEWAEHGILVNVIAPGCVQTPMSHVTLQRFEAEWFKQFFINPERPRIPLMRPAKPERRPRRRFCSLPTRGTAIARGPCWWSMGGRTIKFSRQP